MHGHNNGVTDQCRQMRQQLAWHMKVKGFRYVDIISAFQEAGLGTCTEAQVSYYVKSMSKKLQEEFTDQAYAIKLVQSERYDLIIKESLDAWEASKRPAESTTTVDGRVHVARPPADGAYGAGLPQELAELIPLPAQTTRTVSGSTGNAAYLGKAMEAMKAQAELWGFNVKRVDVSSGGAAIKAYVAFNPEDV